MLTASSKSRCDTLRESTASPWSAENNLNSPDLNSNSPALIFQSEIEGSNPPPSNNSSNPSVSANSENATLHALAVSESLSARPPRELSKGNYCPSTLKRALRPSTASLKECADSAEKSARLKT